MLRKSLTWVHLALAVGVLAIAAGLVIPSVRQARSAAARELCLANLNQIGKAMDAYLRANGDTWPRVSKLRSFQTQDPPWPTLPTVLEPYIGQNTAVFHCPADRRVLADESVLAKDFPRRTAWYETEGLSYEWMWGEAYGGKKVGQEALSQAAGFGLDRADQALLADFEPFHVGDDGGAFNTLYADLKARTARSARKD